MLSMPLATPNLLRGAVGHDCRVVWALKNRHPESVRQSQENELNGSGEDCQPADKDIAPENNGQTDPAHRTRPHPIRKRAGYRSETTRASGTTDITSPICCWSILLTSCR